VAAPSGGGLGYQGFEIEITDPGRVEPTVSHVFRQAVTERRSGRVASTRPGGDIERLLLDQARQRGFADLLDELGVEG
jgi:hypothetical protein